MKSSVSTILSLLAWFELQSSEPNKMIGMLWKRLYSYHLLKYSPEEVVLPEAERAIREAIAVIVDRIFFFIFYKALKFSAFYRPFYS